jgi:hypothetical protein
MARRPPNNDDMARGPRPPAPTPLRRVSFSRAAAAHGRAAEVEKQAAAAFDRLGQPEMVERHRAASRRQTEVAEAEGDEAARWP